MLRRPLPTVPTAPPAAAAKGRTAHGPARATGIAKSAAVRGALERVENRSVFIVFPIVFLYNVF